MKQQILLREGFHTAFLITRVITSILEHALLDFSCTLQISVGYVCIITRISVRRLEGRITLTSGIDCRQ